MDNYAGIDFEPAFLHHHHHSHMNLMTTQGIPSSMPSPKSSQGSAAGYSPSSSSEEDFSSHDFLDANIPQKFALNDMMDFDVNGSIFSLLGLDALEKVQDCNGHHQADAESSCTMESPSPIPTGGDFVDRSHLMNDNSNLFHLSHNGDTTAMLDIESRIDSPVLASPPQPPPSSWQPNQRYLEHSSATAIASSVDELNVCSRDFAFLKDIDLSTLPDFLDGFEADDLWHLHSIMNGDNKEWLSNSDADVDPGPRGQAPLGHEIVEERFGNEDLQRSNERNGPSQHCFQETTTVHSNSYDSASNHGNEHDTRMYDDNNIIHPKPLAYSPSNDTSKKLPPTLSFGSLKKSPHPTTPTTCLPSQVNDKAADFREKIIKLQQKIGAVFKMELDPGLKPAGDTVDGLPFIRAGVIRTAASNATALKAVWDGSGSVKKPMFDYPVTGFTKTDTNYNNNTGSGPAPSVLRHVTNTHLIPAPGTTPLTVPTQFLTLKRPTTATTQQLILPCSGAPSISNPLPNLNQRQSVVVVQGPQQQQHHHQTADFPGIRQIITPGVMVPSYRSQTEMSAFHYRLNSESGTSPNHSFDSNSGPNGLVSYEEKRHMKKLERMVKNRESASLSRRRKKEYVKSLESRIEQLCRDKRDLEVMNGKMKKRIDNLETENTLLKKVLPMLKLTKPGLVFCVAIFFIIRISPSMYQRGDYANSPKGLNGPVRQLSSSYSPPALNGPATYNNRILKSIRSHNFSSLVDGSDLPSRSADPGPTTSVEPVDSYYYQVVEQMLNETTLDRDLGTNATFDNVSRFHHSTSRRPFHRTSWIERAYRYVGVLLGLELFGTAITSADSVDIDVWYAYLTNHLFDDVPSICASAMALSNSTNSTHSQKLSRKIALWVEGLLTEAQPGQFIPVTKQILMKSRPTGFNHVTGFDRSTLIKAAERAADLGYLFPFQNTPFDSDLIKVAVAATAELSRADHVINRTRGSRRPYNSSATGGRRRRKSAVNVSRHGGTRHRSVDALNLSTNNAPNQNLSTDANLNTTMIGTKNRAYHQKKRSPAPPDFLDPFMAAELLKSLNLRRDTHYFVSLKKDFLLFPAINFNETHPKMSIVMPHTQLPTANINGSSHQVPKGMLSMIQLDCEVMDAKMVLVNKTRQASAEILYPQGPPPPPH